MRPPPVTTRRVARKQLLRLKYLARQRVRAGAANTCAHAPRRSSHCFSRRLCAAHLLAHASLQRLTSGPRASQAQLASGGLELDHPVLLRRLLFRRADELAAASSNRFVSSSSSSRCVTCRRCGKRSAEIFSARIRTARQTAAPIRCEARGQRLRSARPAIAVCDIAADSYLAPEMDATDRIA